MNSDVKWIIGIAAIIVAIFGAAYIVSDVIITLAGAIRQDLHDLRDTLERVACGEFAERLPAASEIRPPTMTSPANRSSRPLDPDCPRTSIQAGAPADP